MPGAVVIAQTGVGIAPWKNPNTAIAPFQLSVDCALQGAATYSIEYTQSDVFTPGATPIVVHVLAPAGVTAAAQFIFNFPIRAWRLNVTVGTGTVTAEAMQAGISNE